MRRPAVVVACLLVASCRAGTTEVRADVCGDLAHLAATVDALATYDPETRVGVVRGALEKMDPTFGNLSRSGLLEPAVVDRLLQAHVDYRDLLIGVGDDESFADLGPAAPPAAAAFRRTFVETMDALGCPERSASGTP